jgi:hypothetical protein
MSSIKTSLFVEDSTSSVSDETKITEAELDLDRGSVAGRARPGQRHGEHSICAHPFPVALRRNQLPVRVRGGTLEATTERGKRRGQKGVASSWPWSSWRVPRRRRQRQTPVPSSGGGPASLPSRSSARPFQRGIPLGAGCAVAGCVGRGGSGRDRRVSEERRRDHQLLQ